jgi:cellulose synthase/poly-beta-1,6-N-acetylglucosamine synthase-like glycosyltransferase/peptidoglycan/xylan/chitin deacetylase (PgdA/CDA1 family)
LTANPDGTLTEEEEPTDPGNNIDAALKVVRSHSLQILAMVSDGNAGQSSFVRLSEPKLRSKFEREIIGAVQNHGFDGVVINFSHPAGIDEVAVRTMLKELRTHLLPTKTVAVFVPGDAALDYRALAAACDLVIVELFNEDPAEPGPLALASWSKNTAALRASDIPKEKLIFAIGVFGKDWSDLGGSQPISFNSVMLSAVMQSATIRFDRKSENPRLQFVDGDGHHHDTWFLDAVTFLSLIRDLTQLAPRGIALWEPGLGSEDESLWRLFQSKGFTNLPDPTVLEEIDAGHFIDTVGKGEIYRFLSRPKPGQRTITTTTSGELEEEYNTLPRPWQVEATGVLPHTIALTFDDGPEPEYTERILEILNREQVKATFFVTGGQALRHPAVIRRILNEGHELGNHSWTHPNLSKLPDFLVKLELNATQRLLQVITGSSVRLFRPPYGADDMAETAEDAHVVELASRLGYTLIGANLNPQDWNKPSKQEIIRRIMEQADSGAGSVVELHDAGGDRINTVEALPELIHQLRGKGFRFISVSELIGQETSPMIPVSEAQLGWVEMAKLGFDSMSVGRKVLVGAVWTFIVLTSLRFIILLISALLEHSYRKIYSDQVPTVSVIIPAYNEEAVITRAVASLLQSDYANLREILVVDDGSSDNTVVVVKTAFADDPRVRIFTKPNAGKWSALNFGLKQMCSDIAVMIDADTLLQPDAIRLLARHFADPEVGAVAGNAKVGNRINLVTKLQALEYVTSQNLERAGLARLDAITVVPGAIGAWRREAVLRVGGYSAATLAEDCDLTFCLHRAGYKIVHEMQAVGWTEAPDTWRGFMRQRFRWIYGTLQASYRHADTMFQHRFCAFAHFSLPSILLFTVLLPLVSPVMDLFLLVTIFETAFDIVMHPMSYSLQSMGWGVGSYLFVFGIDALIALLAFSLDPTHEDRRLLAYLPFQRFCYRQILYLVILRALLSCLRGNAQGWNKLARVGSVTFGSPAAADAQASSRNISL